MKMENGYIEEIKTRLRDQIVFTVGSLLDKFPIEQYLEMIEHYPDIADYLYVGPEIRKYAEDILQESNEDILETYHKLLLVELISKNIGQVKSGELPNVVKQLYIHNFNRILSNISSGIEEPGFYLYPNDKFFKDLAICSMRMIPLGAGKVLVRPFPMKFLFTHGIKQFIKGLIFILFELRSIKPKIYESHMDSHDPDQMKEYTPEGRTRYYINAAHLLKMRKEVKGILGISWLFDPKLEEISPKHTYLRKIPLDNGGKIFYIGYNKQATVDALAKSQTRRRLYSEGKYIPTNYLICWPRKKLINWANRASTNKI